jgi:hypothetical protein
MKKLLYSVFSFVCLGLFMTMVSMPLQTWAAEPVATPPPIAQKLVREGDLAVKLVFALGVGVTQDEAEAESRLGELGISPRNGWIADYPVTPDIITELQGAVVSAVHDKKLLVSKEEALARLTEVVQDLELGIRPYAGNGPNAPRSASSTSYQPVTEINTYYSTEGPPVVTYYPPPPDWYYLYGWVPSPFWYGSFWFPGFYVLYDFHRPYYYRDRVGFISNHFNDVRRHRVYRVDPVTRFNGRTYGGIGIRDNRNIISTGVARSERRIFNAPRAVTAPGMQQTPGMRTYAPNRGSDRVYVPDQPRSDRTYTAPSQSIAPIPRAMESEPSPRGRENRDSGGISRGSGERGGQRR